MKKLYRLAAFALVGILLPACSGTTFACKRNSDGTVECAVTTHADGNHNKPVPVEKVEK